MKYTIIDLIVAKNNSINPALELTLMKLHNEREELLERYENERKKQQKA